MNYKFYSVIEKFWDEYYNYFAWFPFFIVIGIIFYFNLSNEPSIIYICGGLSFTGLLLVYIKYFLLPKNQNLIIFICYLITIMIFLIGCGILLAKLDTEYHKKPLISEKMNFQKARGKVVDFIIFRNQNKTCLVIKNFNSDTFTIAKNGLIRACTYDSGVRKIKIGDQIILKNVSIKPLSLPSYYGDYQFARYSYFNNLIGTAYAQSITRQFADKPYSTLERINQWRYESAVYLSNHFGDEVGGIIAAITVGNRMFLTQEISDNMKKSSIFHLIAISGLHISFISLIFASILGRIFTFFFDRYFGYFAIKKIVISITLIATFSYLIASGITLSAQRAFIMFSIISFLMFRNNQIISKNIIIYASLIIIICQPHAILNPGLQMSILAVMALIFFNLQIYFNQFKLSNFRYLRRLIFIFAEVLIPHLAVMPTTLYYFNGTATYSIIANLIAIPLTSFLIMPLIIINFFMKWLASIFAKIFSTNNIAEHSFIDMLLADAINLLIKIGSFFSNLPFGYLQLHQITFTAFIIMIVGLLWLIIFQTKIRFIGLGIYSIGILYCYINMSPDIIVYELRGKVNFIFKNQGNYYNNSANTDSYIARKILNQNNAESFKKINTVNNKLSPPQEEFIKSKKNIIIEKHGFKIAFLKEIDSCENFDLVIYLNNDKIEKCSTWNNFISKEELLNNGTYNIFIKKNNMKFFTSLDYIGNRPWNFKYKNNEK